MTSTMKIIFKNFDLMALFDCCVTYDLSRPDPGYHDKFSHFSKLIYLFLTHSDTASQTEYSL